MQVVFLPEWMAITLCFILWPILQVSAALICLKTPDRCFSPLSFLYRSHDWEKNGAIYKTVLKVHRWKKLLPDGGAVIKGGYRKKSMDAFSESALNQFLIESCRAEMTHWLAILPFWVFGLFAPAKVVFLMFLYALGVNLPCIIAQRYNRPRIHKLLSKMKG
jgi:glycosyl-4,4'-diaponeurosporenoate acyltransferase